MTHLATQVAMIYGVAGRLQSKEIFSGLLGGGAYRNNRPLILLLHLLLQPFWQQEDTMVFFHHPIFSVFGNAENCQELESRLLTKADGMLKQLADKNVTTLYDALCEVHSWDSLMSCHNDADLDGQSSDEALSEPPVANFESLQLDDVDVEQDRKRRRK